MNNETLMSLFAASTPPPVENISTPPPAEMKVCSSVESTLHASVLSLGFPTFCTPPANISAAYPFSTLPIGVSENEENSQKASKQTDYSIDTLLQLKPPDFRTASTLDSPFSSITNDYSPKKYLRKRPLLVPSSLKSSKAHKTVNSGYDLMEGEVVVLRKSHIFKSPSVGIVKGKLLCVNKKDNEYVVEEYSLKEHKKAEGCAGPNSQLAIVSAEDLTIARVNSVLF